ncbi:Metallo-dependent hydrolase [Ramicandelaber brevisporus]|nr:Metallo-dependent hydrolase [Ramicandelaber brevisporus]
MFDAHCHLHDNADVLEQILETLPTRRIVLNGTRPDDWPVVERFYLNYPDRVVPCFGVHPWYAHTVTIPTASISNNNTSASNPEWLDQLEQLLLKYPNAAVGEIGLDAVATHPSTNEKYDMSHQERVFEVQIALAAQLMRPVCVHSVQVHGKMLEFFRKFNCKQNPTSLPPRIMLHSYTGSADIAKQLATLKLKVGERFYFSFSKAINNRNTKWHALLPHDRLLIESDLDSASCEFDMMEQIANEVRDATGYTFDEVIELTTNNAERFFGITA